MIPSRRRFLAAPAVVPLLSRLLAATRPSIKFPTAARDRLSVASYPFRAFIDLPRNRERDPQAKLIDLKEFPAQVAERFQIHNVELLGQHFRSTEPAYLAELRAALKATGSHAVNIPTSAGASLYDADAAQRSIAVANSRKWIDAAVAIDCPSVRIHVQGAKGVTPDVDLTAASLAQVAEYGASRNVVVNLENDNPTTEDAPFLVKVIDQVKSPWLRGLPDFCNSMLKGDEKFNYEAVTAMFQRAYNISHVKDIEVEGEKIFKVDLERTFGIAKAAGYEGYFSMEFEGQGDPYTGTQKLIDASLKALS